MSDSPAFPTTAQIPLVSFDGSVPKYAVDKSSSIDIRKQKLRFLKYASENEIIDDSFKAVYKTTFKKDFPSKAVWKAYLDDMKAKPALHPYDKFLKSKEASFTVSFKGPIEYPVPAG